MTQALLTPSIIAKEALIALENNLVLGNLVYRDYSGEFAKVGNTVTVRKPAEFTANVWDGSQLNTQNITETAVNVVMNTILDVTFNVSSLELTQNIESFSEQVIQPAMRAHAQGIDALLAALYTDIPYACNVPANASNCAAGDIATARKLLNNNKSPLTDRRGVQSPDTEAKYLVLDAFLHAEKRGDTDAIREASMGRVLGIEWYMDQNIIKNTQVLTASNIVANTSNTAMTINTNVVAVGSLLTIQNVSGTYVVTVVAANTNVNYADINVYPALASVADASETLNVWGGGKNNLVFHKNAFALVTRPLAKPFGAGYSDVVNYKGISARVASQYTMASKSDQMSIDILLGTKTLTPELAVRLVDANV